jgi:hypothetical protein
MLGVKGFSLDLAGIDNVRVADPERGSFKDRQERQKLRDCYWKILKSVGAASQMRFKRVIYRKY